MIKLQGALCEAQENLAVHITLPQAPFLLTLRGFFRSWILQIFSYFTRKPLLRQSLLARNRKAIYCFYKEL